MNVNTVVKKPTGELWVLLVLGIITTLWIWFLPLTIVLIIHLSKRMENNRKFEIACSNDEFKKNLEIKIAAYNLAKTYLDKNSDILNNIINNNGKLMGKKYLTIETINDEKKVEIYDYLELWDYIEFIKQIENKSFWFFTYNWRNNGKYIVEYFGYSKNEKLQYKKDCKNAKVFLAFSTHVSLL